LFRVQLKIVGIPKFGVDQVLLEGRRGLQKFEGLLVVGHQGSGLLREFYEEA
jgi:hypothetical protein